MTLCVKGIILKADFTLPEMTFVRIGVRMKKEPKFSESLLSALLLHMFIPCDLRHLCCKKCSPLGKQEEKP